MCVCVCVQDGRKETLGGTSRHLSYDLRPQQEAQLLPEARRCLELSITERCDLQEVIIAFRVFSASTDTRKCYTPQAERSYTLYYSFVRVVYFPVGIFIQPILQSYSQSPLPHPFQWTNCEKDSPLSLTKMTFTPSDACNCSSPMPAAYETFNIQSRTWDMIYLLFWDVTHVDWYLFTEVRETNLLAPPSKGQGDLRSWR